MKCIRELHVTDQALHRTEEWREQYRIVQQAHVPVQKLGVIAVLTCTDEVPGNDFISTRCFFFISSYSWQDGLALKNAPQDFRQYLSV